MVGVVCWVMPSVLNKPVSLAELIAFNTSAEVGALRSTVTTVMGEKALVLPDASTIRALTDWPASSTILVTLIDHVPAVVVANSVNLEAPTHNSTLPPTTAPVPVKVSVVALVMLSVLETPESVVVAKVGAKEVATELGAVMLKLSAGDFNGLVVPATSV